MRNFWNLYSTGRHNKSETEQHTEPCLYASLTRGVLRVRATKEEKMDKIFWGDPGLLILSPSMYEGPDNTIYTSVVEK